MNTTERIAALTRHRSDVANRHRAILASIRPGDPKTATQTATINALSTELGELDDTIKNLALDEQRTELAIEARRKYFPGQSTTTGGPITGLSIGEALRNAIDEVRDGRATAYVDLPDIRNVLTEAGSAGEGVPIQIKNPVATLAASSVVMSLPGIGRETMTSDRAVYPRIGAATVDGVAEGATLTAANTQTDSVTVTAQKFGVLETLTSELVEDAAYSALAAFGDNLIRRLALRVDLGLLEGDGANDIVGMRLAPGVNTTSVAGTPANFAKFRDAEYELLVDNGLPRVWVMHPRTWKTLAGIKTGLASDETTLLEPDPQQGPRTLLGYPVAFSTQITLTEGAGAGSWAALVDTSQLVVCERRPARLEVSRDFKFDEDVVAVRATWRGGLAVLNPEAISLLTDVRA